MRVGIGGGVDAADQLIGRERRAAVFALARPLAVVGGAASQHIFNTASSGRPTVTCDADVRPAGPLG
jgi:hypothetical protein